MSETVLDRIVAVLSDALAYNAGAYEAPIALLWPDETKQWRSVVDRRAEHLPVVSLGDYDPVARRGPGYWVRCVVAGTVDAGLPAGTPIVYLPGVARPCVPSTAVRRSWRPSPSSNTAASGSPIRTAGTGRSGRSSRTPSVALACTSSMTQRPPPPCCWRLTGCSTSASTAWPSRCSMPTTSVISSIPILSAACSGGSMIHTGTDAGSTTPSGRRSSSNARRTTASTRGDGEVSAARKLGDRKGAWAHVWKRFAETPGALPRHPQPASQGTPRGAHRRQPRRLAAGQRDGRGPAT